MPGAMTPSAEPDVEPVVGPLASPGLYRLLAWLSPSFPIGAFSYSHGLEAAVAGAAVRDRASLEGWIAATVVQGSGRMDADILCAAHRAAQALNRAALDAANQRGIAFRATAELALESAQPGAAFLATCRAAWPDPFIEAWAAPHSNPLPAPSLTLPRLRGREGWGRSGEREGPAAKPWEGEERSFCHSAAFGAVAARAGIPLADALTGYLQAFAANLVSAGLRLGIIGQTDGQRILAALEPIVGHAAAAAMVRDPANFGAATFAVDVASMMHETQYTRLFRS
jgi:urease accessory protein